MKKLNITKDWYDNSNVRPKTFNVQVQRNSRGQYELKRVAVVNVNNQHESLSQRVDARDFASDFCGSEIICK